MTNKREIHMVNQAYSESMVSTKISERQKHCPYCHPGSKINGIEAWYDGELALGEVLDDGGYIELYFNPVNQYLDAEGEDSLFVGVKFCPWCGRYLGNE